MRGRFLLLVILLVGLTLLPWVLAAHPSWVMSFVSHRLAG
jgi:hypothetical protein